MNAKSKKKIKNFDKKPDKNQTQAKKKIDLTNVQYRFTYRKRRNWLIWYILNFSFLINLIININKWLIIIVFRLILDFWFLNNKWKNDKIME